MTVLALPAVGNQPIDGQKVDPETLPSSQQPSVVHDDLAAGHVAGELAGEEQGATAPTGSASSAATSSSEVGLKS